MKTNILSAFFLSGILSLSACSYQKSNNDGVNVFNGFSLGSNEGKGAITEKTYNFDFDDIQSSNSLTVEVVKSSTEKVVVSAPSDLIDQIEIRKDGDKVRIKIADGVRNISTRRVKVTVYANDFSKISASSSSSIKLMDAFKGNQFDISTSSSASIKGSFDARIINIKATSSADFYGEIFAQDLNAQVSSSGTINIKGRSENVTGQASSSGDIEASEFVAENAILTASSSGGIKVGVRQSLVGTASSSGDVIVLKKGTLDKVTVKESSSGSVIVK